MSLRGQHVLSSTQFTRADLDVLFELADALLPVAQRRVTVDALRGKVLASLFFEPSTRTRLGFGAAFARLGGCVLDTSHPVATSISKGESLSDTGRVISGYADVIVMRSSVVGSVGEVARGALVPVINAGDGAGEHPTQALLDLYTMRGELGCTGRSIDDVNVCAIGDHRFGRTVHSLAPLLGLAANVTLTLVSDRALRLPEGVLAATRARGVRVRETTVMEDGLSDADIVYMTRVQEERFESPTEFADQRGRYRLTRSLFEALCPPHAVVLHPLPRDGRPESGELSDDLIGHPRLGIFRQSDNGVPIRMALLSLVLGQEEKVLSGLSSC